MSTAPAFALLGTEPATIQRPVSPRGLKTTLFALVGGNDGFPRNFAMEVTPYWLTPRANFSYADYFDRRHLGRTIARSLSLAVATAPLRADDAGAGAGASGDAAASPGTGIAASVRAILVPGVAPRGLYDSVAAAIGGCLTGADPNAACLDSVRRSPSVARLRDYVRTPRGFSLEVAAGVSGASPTDVADDLRLRRVGLWLTPRYRVSGSVELLAIGRLLRERPAGSAGDPTVSLLDYGGRLLWRPVRTLGLSAEAVGRQVRGDATAERRTGRYGGLLEYAATDQLYVFYVFGRDFAAADAPRSRLLSSIGLNVGFGRDPQVKLP